MSWLEICFQTYFMQQLKTLIVAWNGFKKSPESLHWWRTWSHTSNWVRCNYQYWKRDNLTCNYPVGINKPQYKKKFDRNNRSIYCETYHWGDTIFSFQCAGMKSSRIICEYEYPNRFAWMLKLSSMFGSLLNYKNKSSQNNIFGGQIKCCNFREKVYFKLNMVVIKYNVLFC